MWQDDESAKTLTKTWKEAIEYCESLNFAGYSDWRLPNKNELLSIVDRSKYSSAINGVFKNFNTASRINYWSSTSFASNPSNAWRVVFNFGYADYVDKSVSNYVRCVRAGQ